MSEARIPCKDTPEAAGEANPPAKAPPPSGAALGEEPDWQAECRAGALLQLKEALWYAELAEDRLKQTEDETWLGRVRHTNRSIAKRIYELQCKQAKVLP